ncbi:MAG: hypothetical protein IJ797_07565, partial [Selenomonadaceae bacterium]|nr:hypothetical protein [Selenomonadaceae bacterium]
MRAELPYFLIGTAYGGWQEWFSDYMMREGGCAAVTACDCSIYFELFKGIRGLYPYDVQSISRNDYIKFADIMKPYLRPRWTGIDRLDIYIDGFQKFLHDRNVTNINLYPWAGDANLESTKFIIKSQIERGFPIPFLILNHSNPAIHAYYYWHWFILNGCDDSDNFKVKAVSYGSWRW